MESNDDLSNKNLFAYCDNNPVVRLDESGDFWQLALANGGSIAPTLGVTVGIFAKAATTVLGTMSPVGWTVLGVVAVAVLVATGLKYAKKKQKSRNKAKGKEQQKDRNKAPIASRNTYNTRKKAREAAQKAGKGKKPIHHSDGNNPHYHPDVPHKYRSTPHMPTYHDHYFYPR